MATEAEKTLTFGKLYRATRILLGVPGPDIDPALIQAATVLTGRADQEADLPDLSFSSEEPVERWFGIEVLEHTKKAIDFKRAKDGLPLLLDHSTGRQIGIVEEIKLGDDKILRGTPRFSKTDEAQGVKQDVLDGIRKWTSLGYRILEVLITKGKAGAADLYTATRWEPMEVSLVPVPADTTVGAGRDAGDKWEVLVHSAPDTEGNSTEERNMNQKTETPPAPGTASAGADIQAAADAERTRASEIVELCNQYGCGERAQKFITDKLTPNAVAREILFIRADGKLPQPAHESIVNLPEEDAARYSLSRAILSAFESSDGLPRDGLEREVHEEMLKHMPPQVKLNGGFLFPTLLQAKKRALASDAAGAGSELKFEQAGEFIDLLRNIAQVTRLGARTLTGLTAPITFPKQKTGGVASWVGEAPGTDVSESDLTLGTITLAPKTLQSSTSYARQLLVQASVSVEQMVREDMASAHALAIDLAALHGSGGGNQPVGISDAPDVNAKAIGGVPTFALMIDLATEVATDNALFGNLAYLTTPGMAGVLMQKDIGTDTGRFVWMGRHDEGVVAGYRAVSTNQARSDLGAGSDEHTIIFGNWRDLLIGNWGGLEVVVDPFGKKKQGLIEVTTFQMVDILLRHGESFAKGTGAKLS